MSTPENLVTTTKKDMKHMDYKLKELKHETAITKITQILLFPFLGQPGW